MLTLPRPSYRGLTLTYDEFADLTVIGMAGFSDHLLDDEITPYNDDGMVNYKLVADSLGLSYDPSWVDHLSHALENQGEALVQHDCSPGDLREDSCWAYLNSGFGRIALLLKEKYYSDEPFKKLSYDDFRDVLLFELVGMQQDNITEEGIATSEPGPQDYDIRAVAEHNELDFERDWIERVTSEWLSLNYIVETTGSASATNLRYGVTQSGFDNAQTLIEKLSRGDGLHLKQGSGQLFFSVDASHISRLGMELVAKQETAVAELVKNGYDADATNVDLIFSATAASTSSLEIYDNGTGMTIEQLKHGFMKLSTPNKVAEPTTELFNRQKAGRKGIGRFAAQRLGRRLVLETTTKNLNYALKLTIDWDLFEANRNLSSVPNSIVRVKKPFYHGTRLTIQKLRDNWSDAQIERSHRHIAELIQPFPLADVSSPNVDDPGFKASFAREQNGDIVIVADDWSLYFRHALAEIEGSVDENGFGQWSLQSKKFDINLRDQSVGSNADSQIKPYSHLKNIKFKAYYFIDKETQRAFRSKVADKLQSSGGIRLYRNGFRVLPYGERFDDWLKLNASNLLYCFYPKTRTFW